MEDLTQVSLAFDKLLSLIPAKHYLDTPAFEYNSKYTIKKKEIKDIAKIARLTKLDPEKAVKTLDIQSNEAKTALPSKLASMESVSNEELKSRLANRILELKSVRGVDVGENLLQPRSRQEILERRQKKKELQKKKKTNKKSGTTVTAPEISEINPIETKKRKSNDVVQDISFGNVKVGGEKALDIHVPKKSKKGPTDAQGQLNVVCFQLIQIKSKSEKLKQLEVKDPEKAQAIKDNQEWKNVLLKAQGQKIKDDPVLLEKTLKREKKIKEKKSIEWKERKVAVAKGISDRQKKREKNIKERHEGKKDKGKKSSKKSSKSKK